MDILFNTLFEVINYYGVKTPAKVSHIYKDSFGREIRVTYKNFYDSIMKIASGLISIGIGGGSKVALISHTGYEWSLMDMSLLSIGAISIPRGVDTPVKELSNILSHSTPDYLIIETYQDLVKMVPKTAWDRFKKIIILRKGIPYPLKKIVSLNDLFELGEIEFEKNKETFETLNKATGPDSLATIIYTSGTTGNAKGVMLTNANFLQNLKIMTPHLKTRASDLWLSILPVWHAFERTSEYMAYYAGSSIMFSSVQTIGNDMAEYGPTFLNAVPKLFITLKEKISKEINKKNKMVSMLLQYFLKARQGYILAKNTAVNRRFIRHPEDMDVSFRRRLPAIMRVLLYAIPAGLGYALFFSIRKKMGGNIRAFIAGGGSLPVDADLFFWAIGLPVVNAYGTTETSPGISGRMVSQFIPGTVGTPFVETEITIRNEEGVILPKGVQGEIWVRGKQVMQGYYQEPELTKEVITQDGWYRTGDLGVLSYNNHIKITGRAKSVIVLLSGENVQPEPLEEALHESPFIQMSVVVGQDENHLSALIVPFLENIQDHLKSQEKILKEKWDDLEEVINLPQIKKLIDDEIAKLVNKNKEFKPFEKIKNFKLLPHEFKIGEELTQTLKLKRQVVQEKYKKLIDEFYGRKTDAHKETRSDYKENDLIASSPKQEESEETENDIKSSAGNKKIKSGSHKTDSTSIEKKINKKGTPPKKGRDIKSKSTVKKATKQKETRQIKKKK